MRGMASATGNNRVTSAALTTRIVWLSAVSAQRSARRLVHSTRAGELRDPHMTSAARRLPTADGWWLTADGSLEIQLVDEVAEDAELVLFLGPRRHGERGLGHHVLLHIDRRAGTHGQSNGVAGPCVDLERCGTLLQRDQGVEHIAFEIVDHNL